MIPKIRDCRNTGEKDKVVEFHLEYDIFNSEVHLIGVDNTGRIWHIAKLREDGMVLYGGIPVETGIPIDENNDRQIKILKN